MPLLSKAVAEATGMTAEEAKALLLSKVEAMEEKPSEYLSWLGVNALHKDSWAAITLAYGQTDPNFFIRLLQEGGDV